jgi:hypothetical protein
MANYIVASNSNAVIYLDELDPDELEELMYPYEVTLINDLETSTEQVDYSAQIDDINNLLLFGIFAVGVLSGLIFASIMWKRVK